MGLFDKKKSSNAAAGVRAIQKIKSGGTAKLSLSQIVMLITNLPDAKKNLSPLEYEQIKYNYDGLRGLTELIEMDSDEYLSSCLTIIGMYEKIAPYMLFDGNISENLEIREQLKIRSLYNQGLAYDDALIEYQLNNANIKIDQTIDFFEDTQGRELYTVMKKCFDKCSKAYVGGTNSNAPIKYGYILAALEAMFVFECAILGFDTDKINVLAQGYIGCFTQYMAMQNWCDKEIDHALKNKLETSTKYIKKIVPGITEIPDAVSIIKRCMENDLAAFGFISGAVNMQNSLLQFSYELYSVLERTK